MIENGPEKRAHELLQNAAVEPPCQDRVSAVPSEPIWPQAQAPCCEDLENPREHQIFVKKTQVAKNPYKNKGEL